MDGQAAAPPRSPIAPLLPALANAPAAPTSDYSPPPTAIVYKAITPMYRAAAAYALGQIGDSQAVPPLLEVVADLDNALDVRHSAARALSLIADPASLPDMQQLARDYPEVATRRRLLEACARAAARK